MPEVHSLVNYKLHLHWIFFRTSGCANASREADSSYTISWLPTSARISSQQPVSEWQNNRNCWTEITGKRRSHLWSNRTITATQTCDLQKTPFISTVWANSNCLLQATMSFSGIKLWVILGSLFPLKSAFNFTQFQKTQDEGKFAGYNKLVVLHGS